MRSLFGIPVGDLTVAVTLLLGVAFGLLVVLGLRNRILVRLGLRNLPRRPARTAIIVVGLMLATAIISSALVTGDTLSATIRSNVLETLGDTDVVVSAGGGSTVPGAPFDPSVPRGWFDDVHARTIANALEGDATVDGMARAVVESVAVQDRTSRQNEPRLTLFGADRLEGFAPIVGSAGARLTLAELGDEETFLTEDAARDLRAEPGDRLAVLAGDRVAEMVVRDVVRFDGAGTHEGALLVPLATAQRLLDHPGEVQHVLISNVGGATAGAARSGEVVTLLDMVVRPLGLKVEAAKADGLERADAEGGTMLTMFGTFGTFTISAGILLIFLIFVMLAAERRAEMGAARAIGTQRGHLVQLFLFEGAGYDVLAAAVGAVLGVALSYGLVWMIAGAFDALGIELRHTVRIQSLALAYGLGVLLTLVVVALSAWRVSRLNVTMALRNLPEPPSHRRRGRRGRLGAAGLVLGLLMTFAGVSGAQATPFLLGVSIVLAAVAPIAIALGASDRLAFTAAGIAIVVWWLLPFSTYEGLVSGLSMDFSVWVVGGLMVVLGATWVVVYNADLLLAAVMAVFGRIRSITPVLKTSIAYPLRNRFRTGVTLAMFMLVVFTLVTGVTIFNAFLGTLDNTETFGGGFDVRAETPTSGSLDLAAALAEATSVDVSAVEAVGAQSYVPVEATQRGTGRAFTEYPVRGVDDGFISHTTYGLAARARGYGDDRAVWDALASQPGLAIVDPLVVPRRSNFNFGVLPDFEITGFVLEDEVFDPVPVRVRDPQTDTAIDLTVIGVLKDTAPYAMAGLTTSQRTLGPLGERAEPNVHHLALRPGTDPVVFAATLESAFLANGMQAKATRELLDEAVGSSISYQRLVLWYLGLGLLIGVVALGVISARSVVERRQQIGVLRAIGFQKRMVQASFLLESSFVSLLAIAAGTVLGLMMSYNVVADQRTQPSWEDMAFDVPWVPLVGVFALVYVAALLATALPARRAARTYPAEALRYE